jgi:hypothetical protein
MYSGSPVNTYHFVEKIGGTAILAGLLTPWLHQASPEWFHIEPSALRHRLFHGLYFGYFCGIILPIQLSIFIFIYLSRCRSEAAARLVWLLRKQANWGLVCACDKSRRSEFGERQKTRTTDFDPSVATG